MILPPSTGQRAAIVLVPVRTPHPAPTSHKDEEIDNSFMDMFVVPVTPDYADKGLLATKDWDDGTRWYIVDLTTGNLENEFNPRPEDTYRWIGLPVITDQGLWFPDVDMLVTPDGQAQAAPHGAAYGHRLRIYLYGDKAPSLETVERALQSIVDDDPARTKSTSGELFYSDSAVALRLRGSDDAASYELWRDSSGTDIATPQHVTSKNAQAFVAGELLVEVSEDGEEARIISLLDPNNRADIDGNPTHFGPRNAVVRTDGSGVVLLRARD